MFPTKKSVSRLEIFPEKHFRTKTRIIEKPGLVHLALVTELQLEMVKFIIKSIRVFGVVRRFISGALQTFGLPTPLRDRLRLRVVPHFSSGIVERAKGERE